MLSGWLQQTHNLTLVISPRLFLYWNRAKSFRAAMIWGFSPLLSLWSFRWLESVSGQVSRIISSDRSSYRSNDKLSRILDLFWKDYCGAPGGSKTHEKCILWSGVKKCPKSVFLFVDNFVAWLVLIGPKWGPVHPKKSLHNFYGGLQKSPFFPNNLTLDRVMMCARINPTKLLFSQFSLIPAPQELSF